MKIAYATSAVLPSRWASSISALKTGEALAKTGHDVEVFGRSAMSGGSRDLDVHEYYDVEPAVRVTTFPCPPYGRVHGLRYGRRVARRLASGSFDLVIARDLHAAFWTTRMTELPLIFEAHGPPRRVRVDLLTQSVVLHERCAGVAVASRAVRDAFVEGFPRLDPNRVRVVYNGADSVAASHPRPASWPGRTGCPQVGYVGSFVHGKGVEIVVELARRMAGVDVHVIGGPTELLQIRDPIGNLHVHGIVPHGRISSYVQALDVFLVPQQRDVRVERRRNLGAYLVPLKVFEGMAHAVPICASDVPIIREILTDGVDAILVPPDDLDAWTEAITALTTDRSKGERLGLAARATFEERFTWKHRAEGLLELAAASV